MQQSDIIECGDIVIAGLLSMDNRCFRDKFIQYSACSNLSL